LDNFEDAKQFADQLSKDEKLAAKLFATAAGFETNAAKKIKEHLATQIRETENEMLIKEYFGY
jgi:ribonucleotide reductase beta subunit family protein with ferritin-like domain